MRCACHVLLQPFNFLLCSRGGTQVLASQEPWKCVLDGTSKAELSRGGAGKRVFGFNLGGSYQWNCNSVCWVATLFQLEGRTAV